MKHSLLEFSQQCLLDVGHEHFSFVESTKEDATILSTYPDEWTKRYLIQKYYKWDYGLVKNLYLPYAWGGNISKDATPIQMQIFKEAEDFHIFKGITIPFSSKESNGIISLAFNKKEKLSPSKILGIGTELRLSYHLIITYKGLLETSGNEAQNAALKLIHELAMWQRDYEKQRKKHTSTIMEILSNIRAAQMFIIHHETKDLGFETLHRAYKDVEKLI